MQPSFFIVRSTREASRLGISFRSDQFISFSMNIHLLSGAYATW